MEITATWSSRDVVITIADDGPGIPPLVLDALGEPYITTRPIAARSATARTANPPAWALASSSPRPCWSGPAPRLLLENREEPATGAVAKVTWRRDVFEARPTAAVALAELRADGMPPALDGEDG